MSEPPPPSTGPTSTGSTSRSPKPDRAAMLTEARAVAASNSGADGGTSPTRSVSTYRWSRWLHVYTSMIAFFVIMFFGITGVTLNHPSWTFGDDEQISAIEGTLAVAPTNADGSINYLGVSEWVRAEHGVGGDVNAFNATADQATIAYRSPGYEADLIFDVNTGEYTLNTVEVGWVGVMNDLHKGRNADSSWRWLIDLSGIFLVVVSITGVVMQFYLRKRRTSALISAAIGTVVVLILIWITLQ